MGIFNREREQGGERNEARRDDDRKQEARGRNAEDRDSVFDKAREVRNAVVERAREAKAAVLGVADQVLQAGEKAKELVLGQELDALQFLKKDHELVNGIFQQLGTLRKDQEKKGVGELREGLFAQLDYELSAHAAIEEEIFYPELRKLKDASEKVTEALDEHRVVKQLLAELATMQIGSEEWNAKLNVLQENVTQHVKEEETELFKLARANLNEQQLRDLGLRLDREKQTLAATGKPDLPGLDKGDKGSGRKDLGKREDRQRPARGQQQRSVQSQK